MQAAIRKTQASWSRFRYRIQHQGLASALNLGVSLWHQILDPKTAPPTRREARITRQRFLRLLERDLENVEQGIYPAELLFQFPMRDYLKIAPEGFAELVRVYRSKRARASRQVSILGNTDEFPRYYLQNFHWQTDGWLSARSARLYDIGVEFLFLGTADIMRRMALRPIVKGLSDPTFSPRVLDLACGTGRFLLQIRRALPRARITGLDLSPFYLRHAAALVGEDDRTAFVQANAESIPFESESQDAVTSVYLFHELPKDARRNVAREAFRVLRPGGRFTICDSAQLVDNDELEAFLTRFPAMYHEPFYKGYLRDDLAKILEEAGFKVVESDTHLISRVISAEKLA